MDARSLMLALSVLCAGCGEDGPPSCANVDWYPVAPYLTGPPAFTASRISPGAPLTLTVPVSTGSSRVSVGIRLVDDPQPGRSPDVQLQAPTGGQNVVRLPVPTDGLALGTYLATSVSVEEEPSSTSGLTFPRGEYAVPSYRSPSAADVGTSYVATYYFGGDGHPYRCQTSLPAPAFEVWESTK